MTESVSNVYDLIYASPITLKEISSIVVAVELWRKEICAQLESKRLHELDLENNIPVRTVLPTLPSTIYNLLEEYVDAFRKSIKLWQKYHHDYVFNDSGSTNFLNRFDDFAWDWDGTIHYARTAKRMILCDRFTEDEKFKIACLYCFEDDIQQIWPSVSRTKDLNEIGYRTNPLQYYWICYLRNELHKIPNPENVSIDQFMINTWCGNRSSVMYFWNRLPSDWPIQSQPHFWYRIREIFIRFILPKLNHQQLDIFVASEGVTLIRSMLLIREREAYVLPIWMYIRSRMDVRNFTDFIHRILKDEALSVSFHPRSGTNLFGEIWGSAPQHFKQSVLDVVLHDDWLLRVRYHTPGKNRVMKFLIRVLQDASFEERNAFWHEHWSKLIYGAPVSDFVFIMNSSFRNENEITLFKENVMSVYENMPELALFLKYGMFEELNDFLSVCCLDERKRNELKQLLLRSNYIGVNSVHAFDVLVVRNNKLLNEFIDDAFQDAADLGVEFRNQLTSSPRTEDCLLECIHEGCLVDVMEFVDTFYPDEQVVVPLKKRLFERFKERLIAGSILHMDSDDLQVFLIWLLASEDEIIRFKQSIPVEEVFRTMMQIESTRYVNAKLEFPKRVDHFLMWYFNKDEEEIEKFTELFLNEFESFAPRKRRTIV